MGELATRVRSRYPGSYDNLSDEELERRVIAKYPVYASLASAPATPAQAHRPVLSQYEAAGRQLLEGAQAGADWFGRQLGVTRAVTDPASRSMTRFLGAGDPSTWRDDAGQPMNPTAADIGMEAVLPDRNKDRARSTSADFLASMFGSSWQTPAGRLAARGVANADPTGVLRLLDLPQAFEGAGKLGELAEDLTRPVLNVVAGVATDPASAAGAVAAGRALAPRAGAGALKTLAGVDRALAGTGAAIAGTGAVTKGAEAVEAARQGDTRKALVSGEEALLNVLLGGAGALGARRIKAPKVDTGPAYHLDPDLTPEEAAAARRAMPFDPRRDLEQEPVPLKSGRSLGLEAEPLKLEQAGLPELEGHETRAERTARVSGIAEASIPPEVKATRLDRMATAPFETALEAAAKLPGVGRQVAGRLKAFLWDRETGSGRHTAARWRVALGLSDDFAEANRIFEESGIRKYLDGKAPLESVAEQYRPQAEALRADLDAQKREAVESGLISPDQAIEEGYFPHYPLRPEQHGFARKVGELVEAEGLTPGEAAAQLREGTVAASRAGRRAQSEHARGQGAQALQEGEYRTDLGVLFEHADEMARRIAEAKHLGKNGEAVQALIGTIDQAGTGRDYKRGMTILDRIRGVEPQGTGTAVSSLVRSWQAGSGLAMAPLNQATTLAMTAAETGERATAQALGAVFGQGRGRGLRRLRSSLREAELTAEERGALFSSIADGLASEFGTARPTTINAAGERVPLEGAGAQAAGRAASITSRLPWIRAVGGADRIQRMIAVKAAEFALPRLLADAKGRGRRADRARTTLREWGVDPTATDVTPEMVQAAGKRVSDKTQLRVDPAHLPVWASHPMGKVAFQFSSFLYGYTRYMWGEARRGNVAPLARAVAYGSALGYGSRTASAWLKGQGYHDPTEEAWSAALTKAFRGRGHYAPTTLKGAALAAVEGLGGAGGLGIFQAALERATGGDATEGLLGATGRDLGNLWKMGEPLGKRSAATTARSTARASGDVAGEGAAIEAQAKAENELFKAGARTVAGALPQLPFGLAPNEWVREITAEPGKLPEQPGWVGRARDVVEGRQSAADALLGVFTGARAPEREAVTRQTRAAERGRAASAGTEALLRDKPMADAEERAAKAEKGALREEYQQKLVLALRSGDQAAAARVMQEMAMQRIRPPSGRELYDLMRRVYRLEE